MTFSFNKTHQNNNPAVKNNFTWSGSEKQLSDQPDAILQVLSNLDQPVFFIQKDQTLYCTNSGQISNKDDHPLIAFSNPVSPSQFGNQAFMDQYHTKFPLYAGSMAHAISSVQMVIEMGKAGILASYGSGGVIPEVIEKAILEIKTALPNGPYAFNLIHSPNEPAMEHKTVELFLKHEITCVEASAFLDMTASLVYYRLAGLSTDSEGNLLIKNHIIAKISRREVATRFMQPAPDDLIQQLLSEGKITEEQARLAKLVPMADDVTVEADSGGHTDNRPLVCQLPSIIALRDEIQSQNNYPIKIRVGAGGGISTPVSALGAFMMGAAYIVTGSVNQACVESGASEHTRKLLAQADMADVMMAPAADMFEMGVKVQLLKRGTMFPIRAQKLYDLYKAYDSIEQIPAPERQKIEKQFFKKSLDDIWSETNSFFEKRDPAQIERAQNDPRHKMALIFRWYLGKSTYWSNSGEKGREMDYQIWCGPAMGAFNDWARGTYLEETENRRVADITMHILQGCAFLYRIQNIRMQGVEIESTLSQYRPMKKLV